MIDASATLLQGFAVDGQATVRLVQHPAFGKTVTEANAMVRAIGPDAYFAPIILWTARHCTAIPWFVTVGQWAWTTAALNTHVAFGTASALPWLVFTLIP